jgi:ribose-phosphate pyrophosphokinase
VTHAVFSNNAYNRIEKSDLEKLYISDTIYFDESRNTKKIVVRTASKIFSEAIRRTHNHESISSLFDIDKG